MRKSLFTRMFLIYFAVSIVSLSLLGIIVAEMFRSSFLDQKRDLLLQSVSSITDIAEQKYSGRISDTSFLYQLANTARDTGADVWLTDSIGNVWVMADVSGSEVMTDSRFTDTVYSMNQQATVGATVQFVSATQDGTPFMLLASPLVINGEIVGALFLEADLTTLYQSLNTIYRQIALTSLASCLAMFVFIYLLAGNIARDIGKITYAAKAVGRGNYAARVTVKSSGEIGELAATFNKMAKDIEQLEGLRSSFVANVSHELRTPMTAIQGFVQGILDGAIPPEEETAYLEKVLSETKRLNKLISDLLELSKVQSGKFPMNIVPTDINELLVQRLITFEAVIEQKKIDVDVQLDQDKLVVKTDPDRIAQVINNLIDNAVKFTPEGGRLTVATKVTGSKKAEVSVSDSGPGIPEVDLPYIFERFYKADKSHRRNKPGYGLGLSIVKSIVDQLGETITVTSEPGHGTTFTFTQTKQL